MIENPVKINTYGHINSANLAKLKLERYDIEAEVYGGNDFATTIDFSSTSGGFPLMVDKEVALKAREILLSNDDIGELIEADELIIDDDQIQCPECGSINFQFKKFKFSILPPFFSVCDEYYCYSCSNRWQEGRKRYSRV